MKEFIKKDEQRKFTVGFSSDDVVHILNSLDKQIEDEESAIEWYKRLQEKGHYIHPDQLCTCKTRIETWKQTRFWLETWLEAKSSCS